MNRLIAITALSCAGLFACAHAKPEAETVAPAPTVAAKPKMDPLPMPEQQQVDLAALLNGTMIHFDFDRADLTDTSRVRLQSLAEALKQHGDIKIRIDGNCDEAGTEEYNIALGQKRAEAARTYLASLGIDSTRLETVSFGKERPIDPGHSPEADAKNRRDGFQPANP